MRTLLDLAIERIYAAGMGDISWNDALAAIARSQEADSALLYAPEGIGAGAGLWALHDRRRSWPALRAVTMGPRAQERSEVVFSAVLADDAEHAMPATLFVLFRAGPASHGAPQAEALEAVCRHLSLAIRLWFLKQSLTRTK